MTSWSFLEAASHLLPPDDRDVVLGDLAETNEGPRQMLAEVLGLVARRHMAQWKSWQPWLAAFGLALPTSFILMGTSVSVSSTLQQMRWQIVTQPSAFLNLLPIIFLLASCSWAAGYVASSISQKTLWMSAVSCLVPCLFCFARFRIESLPRASLFLFVLPAALGVWQGIRATRIYLSFATVMAVAVTMLMVHTWSRGSWLCNVVLLWPAWYIAATTSGNITNQEKRMTS